MLNSLVPYNLGPTFSKEVGTPCCGSIGNALPRLFWPSMHGNGSKADANMPHGQVYGVCGGLKCQTRMQFGTPGTSEVGAAIELGNSLRPMHLDRHLDGIWAPGQIAWIQVYKALGFHSELSSSRGSSLAFRIQIPFCRLNTQFQQNGV